MTYKTVHLALAVEDEPIPHSVADYALSFCDRERAHLSVHLAALVVDVPSGRLVPLVHAMLDVANEERLSKANVERERIETSARLSGITCDCEVVQKPYPQVRAELISTGRLGDLIIVQRPAGFLSFEKGIVEGIIFGTGRPVLVVPAEWKGAANFNRIVVAWDGGQKAARAVGDASPLLEKSTEVEIVCVTSEANKSAAGADLAQHLARHCGNIKLTELEITYNDAARTLNDHLHTVTPDLLVMGAYAHPRLLQFVLGGVTDTMLRGATLPVLYSH
jgi:nucleotide-binding universal stress UspA family protein